MKGIVASVVLVLTLAGCAPIPRLTEADAATWGARFDDAYACREAGDNRVEKSALTEADRETAQHNRGLWLKEVVRRGLVTQQEQQLIAARQIRAGMSQCALYASWGLPIKENRGVYPGAMRIQHVYGRGQYVYTVNGKVTSWQDFQ